mgnify:CR=1 FL=1
MLSVRFPEDKDKRGESNLYVRMDLKLGAQKETFLEK